MNTCLVALAIIAIAALLRAGYWIRSLRKRDTPWLFYNWAENDLLPHHDCIPGDRDADAVSVKVSDLRPGDRGWIHRSRVRFREGHRWVESHASVYLGRRPGDDYVRIGLNQTSIVVEGCGFDRMSPSGSYSKWYFAR